MKNETFLLRHHYILHALNSEILLTVLLAIREKHTVSIITAGKENATSSAVIVPLKILYGVSGGQQYIGAYTLG